MVIAKVKRKNRHEKLVSLSRGNKANGRKYRNNAKSYKSHIIPRELPPFCTKIFYYRIKSIPASAPILCSKKIQIAICTRSGGACSRPFASTEDPAEELVPYCWKTREHQESAAASSAFTHLKGNPSETINHMREALVCVV